MGWIRFESLNWQPVPMPYSSSPVRLARLPLDGSVFLAFVRFPAGWSRTVPVTYQATEEFVIVEGDLRINDHHWEARSYGCVPAGLTRGITESRDGCLAWARFHGSPKPFRAEGSADDNAPGVVKLDLGDLSPARDKVTLHRLALSETWFAPFFDTRQMHSSGGSRYDALALDDLSWWTASSPPDSGSTPADSPGGQPAIVHRTSETPR